MAAKVDTRDTTAAALEWYCPQKMRLVGISDINDRTENSERS